MTTTLPQLERFIPLAQAAKRLGITTDLLRRRIESGSVTAIVFNDTLAVAERDLTEVIPITRDQFFELRGQPITLSAAVKQYGINHVTLKGWVKRGYIAILKDGYGLQIDAADMAYCAAVYAAQGGMQGKRIFDAEGQPYQPKKSHWAAYQRERRKKKKADPLTIARPQL